MGTLWEQREWKQCFFHSFLFPFKNNIKFLTHKSQQHFTVPVKSSKLARKAPLSITTWNSLSHTLMGVQMFVQLEKLFFLHAVSHEHSNCELGGGPPSSALWTFTYCLSRCSLYLIFYIVSGDFFLKFLISKWKSVPLRPDVSPFGRRQAISHRKYRITSQGHSQKLLCLIKCQASHQFPSLSSI